MAVALLSPTSLSPLHPCGMLGIVLPQGDSREDAGQFQGMKGAWSVEHSGTLVQGGSWVEEANTLYRTFSILRLTPFLPPSP